MKKELLVCSTAPKLLVYIVTAIILSSGLLLLYYCFSGFFTEGFSRAVLTNGGLGVWFLLGAFLAYAFPMSFAVYEDGSLEFRRSKLIGGNVLFHWKDIESVIENPYTKYAPYVASVVNIGALIGRRPRFEPKVTDTGLFFKLKDGREPFFHFYFSNTDKFLVLLKKNLKKEVYAPVTGLIELKLKERKKRFIIF